uniref:Cytokine receptor-like factor 2-like domain-containing protein n=2 Tax=Sphenodon punctatus TaxID=8508 RepID=A0A8D0G7W3_SPHPU
MFLILSLLLSGPAQWAMAAPHPQGLECIVFNEEYMTCMWGSPEKPAANYSLYYWYGHGPPMVECKRYLQKESINIGCWFHQSEIIQFQAFHVYVNTSLDVKSHVIPTVVMKLQNQGMEE